MIQGVPEGGPSPAQDEYAPVIFYTEPIGHIVSLDVMSGKVILGNLLFLLSLFSQ